MEIMDILRDDNIDKEKLLSLIPELNELEECPVIHPAHKFDILTHTLEAVKLVKKDILKVALLLHDIGKPSSISYGIHRVTGDVITNFPGHPEKSVELSEPILKRLQVNPSDMRLILKLIYYHDTPIESTEKMKDIQKEIGTQGLGLLLEMQEADLCTHADEYRNKKMLLLQGVKRMYKELIEKEENEI